MLDSNGKCLGLNVREKKNLKIVEHIEKRENVKQLAVQYRTVLLDLQKGPRQMNLLIHLLRCRQILLAFWERRKPRRLFVID